MSSSIRRVVTGHDDTGKAVVLMDGAAPNAKVRQSGGGLISTLIWVTEETPADISGTNDRAEKERPVPPPTMGSAFRIVEFPPMPADSTNRDNETFLREIGVGHGAPARHALMHRTKSVDYAIVMTGEIHMLLDDSEIHLKAGDVLIQQGTNHAWVNRSKEPCRVAFAMLDAAEPAQWKKASR